MKGRNEKGYPLEGVDMVPEHKGKRKPLYSKEQDFHTARLNPVCLDSLSYYNKPTKEWNN